VSKNAKGWGNIAAIAFKKAVAIADGDSNLLCNILKAYPYHWANDHTHCTISNCNHNMSVKLSKESNEFQVLNEYFFELSKFSKNYSQRASTQKNESFNRKIKSFATKNKDYKSSYKNRVDLGVLDELKGEGGREQVLVNFGVVVNDYTSNFYNFKQKLKDKDNRRKQSQFYKRKRKNNKKDLKEKHKKQNVNENY